MHNEVEKKENKVIRCATCEEKLLEHTFFVQCDKCEEYFCVGTGSGSCWHCHLMDFHSIDWTIHYSDEFENQDSDDSRNTPEKTPQIKNDIISDTLA